MAGEDLFIENGTLFDGEGGPGRPVDLLVRDGKVAGLFERGQRGTVAPEARVIEAAGCWVTPGFIDNHTHYDAELEVHPALSESVRHGVTTVLIGSCGLSMAVGKTDDLADMFCRVEGIPRHIVKPLFERVKTWETPAEYLQHLRALPLGPNVTAMLGHSTIRAHVMGLGRSLSHRERPTEAEHRRMAALLEEALDEGYLGLSINTLPWDKMDGDAYRSRPTPSVFARWSEYRRLARVLRYRRRILQGVPNISTKLNLLLFFGVSLGVLRPGLKTAMISMVDAKATRAAFRLAGALTVLANRLLGADVRFQSLPNVFDLWVDGMDVPVFEEFGAGTEALHLRGWPERQALLRDPEYRRRFRRDWGSRLYGRAYHRDLYEARIVGCPDPALVGKTFGEVAEARGQEPVDCLLDLLAAHGDALRWYTVLGNDRPKWLAWIVAHPAVQLGFSDAGAHLRNMAYYNFPLRMLRMVWDAERAGAPIMSVGRAVQRLTSEIADWLGIDAGHLAVGRRADLVVVDPAGLDARVDALEEAEMPGFEGLRRLVRRNDDAVRAVVVGGRLAASRGALVPEVGTEVGFGRVLTAGASP